MENTESGNGTGSRAGTSELKLEIFEDATDNRCLSKTFHLDTLYSFSY